MSWYVGEDGEQIWINRDSTVYTVVVSDAPLPLEHLTYLAVSSKKAVFQEAICEDEGAAGGRSKRNKDKNAGRQRGFIIRQEVEESPLTRVVACFKDAAKKLMDTGIVSRVDADEAANVKKAKKKEKANDAAIANLGANECRIETISRIHHFAHGPGYRLQVAEGMVAQRLNLFTNRREIALKDWLSGVLGALESTGTHIMLLKRSSGNGEVTGGVVTGEKTDGGDDQKKEGKATGEMKIQLRRDKAQQAENDWLQSLLGGEAEKEPEPPEPEPEKASPAPAEPIARPASAPSPQEPPELPQTEATSSRRRGGNHRDYAEAPQPRRAWLPGSKNAWAPAVSGNYTNGWEDGTWQNGDAGWSEWNDWTWWQGEQAVVEAPVPAPAPARRWNKQAPACDECLRAGGGLIKLFKDGDGKYCRRCWFAFYLEEPPADAAVR